MATPNASQKKHTPEHLSKTLDGSIKTTQSNVCEKHGAFDSLLISSFGSKQIFSQCPECQKAADEKMQKELDAQQAYEEKVLIEDLITRSEIPERFKRCTIENYKTSKKEQTQALKICKSYLSTFDKIDNEGVCLTFCGKPGTGKTHLACAIGNALIQKKVSVRYTKAYNAMQEIKSTYHKNAELNEKAIIGRFVTVDLLIIDEVGVQFGSDADKILLYQIINGRYERVKPTILISNLTKDELVEYIGERSVDRLKEGGGVVIPFTWNSFRK